MKRDIRPCWTPITFQKLLEKRAPAPLLVFANFYIHVLWPTDMRTMFSSFHDMSNLPWNSLVLSNEVTDKWYPHQVKYHYA